MNKQIFFPLNFMQLMKFTAKKRRCLRHFHTKIVHFHTRHSFSVLCWILFLLDKVGQNIQWTLHLVRKVFFELTILVKASVSTTVSSHSAGKISSKSLDEKLAGLKLDRSLVHKRNRYIISKAKSY